MIRPFTCICMLLAAGSGLYLYQTKHRAQLLDREIARTYKQIDQAHDRINALKAEWALLNEPDRLKELADQHTSLHTLATTQFVAMSDLPARLPAPLPPGTPAIPADDAPIAPVASAAPAPAPTPVAAAAAAKVAAPVRVAASEKPAPTAEKAAADKAAADKAVAEKPAQPVAVAHAAPAKPVVPVAVAAASLPPPRPLASPAPRFLAPVVAVSAGAIGTAPATAPGTIGESVLRAGRVHAETASAYTPPAYHPQAGPQPSYVQPAYAQPSYAQPSYAGSPAAGAYGSALGSAAHTALPPPVPFGAAQSGG